METSEADAAFYSFAVVMLSLYIVPAALFALYRLVKSPKQARTWGFAAHVVALAVAMALAAQCLRQLQTVDTSGVFDPYEILQISDGTGLRDIKKAYRRLSRELHPDKNLGSQRAAATRFARVAKAYEALTDPKGMENFRKYGHPDGRQALFMDFALLSTFSGASAGSSSLFVLAYFTVVLGALAYVGYSLHRRSGSRDRTQISNKTAALLVDALAEKMSVHDIVELLLATDEMTTYPNAADHRLEAQQRAQAHNKLVKKMEAARVLPGEIFSRIKKHPDHVARENMLALYQYLRRNKLHGVPKPTWLDTRLRKVLLELPFLVEIFATIAAEHSVKRGFTAQTLSRALSLLSSLAQGSFVADDDALRDQRARLADGAELPQLSIEAASVAVLDEANVQPGDWLTVELTLARKHVAAGDTAPLATTFYDEIDAKSPFRKEHVWFLVSDRASNRLYAAWKCVDLSQMVTQKMGFKGPGLAGKYEMEIRAVAVAYLDVHATFKVPLVVETPRS